MRFSDSLSSSVDLVLELELAQLSPLIEWGGGLNKRKPPLHLPPIASSYAPNRLFSRKSDSRASCEKHAMGLST